MKFKDVFNRKEYVLPEGRTPIWRPSAYALVEHDDKILFVRDAQHKKLELPGGGINLSEPIREGVVREVFEETGYRVRGCDHHPFYTRENFFYSHTSDEYWHAILMFFKADLLSSHQETKHIDSNEISEVVWASLQELSSNDVTKISKDEIECAKTKYVVEDFDFFIPQKYRGKKIVVQEKITLDIPQSAMYLKVNHFEDEEEFLGIQGDSDSQQISYYGAKKYLACQDFDKQIITDDLMLGLERILEKLY